MDESITEFYYEQLNKDSNKVKVLVNYYRSLFDVNKIDPRVYKIFARLYKGYGADVVFFAILDCLDVDDVDINNITGLITYFAKKRLQEKLEITERTDLHPYIDEIRKKIER